MTGDSSPPGQGHNARRILAASMFLLAALAVAGAWLSSDRDVLLGAVTPLAVAHMLAAMALWDLPKYLAGND